VKRFLDPLDPLGWMDHPESQGFLDQRVNVEPVETRDRGESQVCQGSVDLPGQLERREDRVTKVCRVKMVIKESLE